MSTKADEAFEDYIYDDQCGDYVECWNCGGEGVSHHDCGEDTCCCLYPEDNVMCDICDGAGGWQRTQHTSKGDDNVS